MTTLTGAERATARCNRPGRPTSGPMAEMMARAGFSADHIRRSGETFRANFCEPGAIGQDIMHDEDARTFVRSFRETALAMDLAGTGLAQWMVEVDVTDRTCSDGRFCVETSVCEILAANVDEATLVASQLVASTHDDGNAMVVATRIIE